MGLTNENVGPKTLVKIKIYVLTRAELLFKVCYEIPCTLAHFESGREMEVSLLLFLLSVCGLPTSRCQPLLSKALLFRVGKRFFLSNQDGKLKHFLLHFVHIGNHLSNLNVCLLILMHFRVFFLFLRVNVTWRSDRIIWD